MSLVKSFIAKRKPFVFGAIALLSLTIFVAININVLAQVSNYVLQDGASIDSPSGLKEIPSELGSHSTETRSNTSDLRSQANSESENLPDYIVYRQIFRHMHELDKKAKEDEALGKDGDHYRNLYKKMANLTNQEAEILDRISRQTIKELSILDNQARIIITELRSQVPDRKLQQGQEPPQPPTELIELTNKQKQLILDAISDLQTQLGQNSFAKLQSFVDQQVKPGVKAVN